MPHIPHGSKGALGPSEILAPGPLFANLTLLPDLDSGCPSARRRAYGPKATVYAQGEACSAVFILLSGQVKLARLDGQGNEFTTGLLAPGELFGPGLAGLEATEAQETVVTREPVSLWQVPAQEFQGFLLRYPAICLRVMEALARRQQQTERRLVCVAFKRTEARLAETLRELSGGFELRCEHGFGQHLRITQQELADLVGCYDSPNPGVSRPRLLRAA